MPAASPALAKANLPPASLPAVTPVTGDVGASVSGLDLRVEPSPEVQRLLVHALHEHGVLFVRSEVDIDPEGHKRLGRVFGDLVESPFNPGDIPLVSVLDSEKVGKTSSTEWHTDATVLAEPPGVAALRAIVLPKAGGDTMWASMYAAYVALSPKMQRFLEGLEADRPALYVNAKSTERILGLSEQESASVLKLLFDHVNTPDFHVRLKWDTRTVAVWEERVTQHRIIKDYTGRRIMHRVVVNGDAPRPYGEIVR